MSDALDTRQLLLAYLLGELAPAERSAMEERMLSEPGFSDLLQDAEYDLMDDYHAARLTARERARAQAALGAERLAESSRITPRTRPPAASAKPVQRSSSVWLRWPVAVAALVLLAIPSWFFISRARQANHNLPQSAATSSHGGVAPVPVGPPASTLPGEDRNSTAVLLLASDVTRGPEGLSLVLHAATHAVIVQWVVPPTARAKEFQLAVTRNGKVVGTSPQQEGLKSISGQQVAEFSVDPALLADGKRESHLLLLIRGSAPHAPVLAEYPIIVRTAKP